MPPTHRPTDFADALINLHRLAGATNIAKAIRHHARDTKYPLTLLLTS